MLHDYDAKKRDKILAQEIPQYVKRIICHDQVGLFSRDSRLIQYSQVDQC